MGPWRASQSDVREHLRPSRAARALCARGRPAHVFHDLSGGARSTLRRGLARARRGRRLRDWRTSSCLGNAALRFRRCQSPRSTRCRSSEERFEQQLAQLSGAIAASVGIRPVSYRSGRFGLGASHVTALERSGYHLDSTVVPLFNETHKGGPDFVGRGASTRIFSPMTMCGVRARAMCSKCPCRRRSIAACLAGSSGRTRGHRVRILRDACFALWASPACCGCAHRIRRSSDMQMLASRICRAGVPVLNVIFHSSEALVGGSPYNRTVEELTAVPRPARAVPALRGEGSRRDTCDLSRVSRDLLMRICHITPHLPPDQAANALLPYHLGLWAREAGDEPVYIAHPSRDERDGERRVAVARRGHVGAAPAPCAIAVEPREDRVARQRLVGGPSRVTDDS